MDSRFGSLSYDNDTYDLLDPIVNSFINHSP